MHFPVFTLRNRKHELGKQRGSWWTVDINPVLPIAGKKFFAIFRETFGITALFQNSVSIYFTFSRGILDGKPCFKVALAGAYLE